MPRVLRRRRCPFCQTLFRPHPRLGPRQWTCGAPACQQQRHAASCRTWRRRNRSVTRSHYQDYVRPARAAARAPTPVPSPRHAQLILASLRPEWRDAIMAQVQPAYGVRSP
jgi:hypothetical protein